MASIQSVFGRAGLEMRQAKKNMIEPIESAVVNEDKDAKLMSVADMLGELFINMSRPLVMAGLAEILSEPQSKAGDGSKAEVNICIIFAKVRIQECKTQEYARCTICSRDLRGSHHVFINCVAVVRNTNVTEHFRIYSDIHILHHMCAERHSHIHDVAP